MDCSRSGLGSRENFRENVVNHTIMLFIKMFFIHNRVQHLIERRYFYSSSRVSMLWLIRLMVCLLWNIEWIVNISTLKTLMTPTTSEYKPTTLVLAQLSSFHYLLPFTKNWLPFPFNRLVGSWLSCCEFT